MAFALSASILKCFLDILVYVLFVVCEICDP